MRKILVYGFLGANLACVLYLWFSNSGGLFASGTAGSFELALGRLSGLLLVKLVLMQFLIMSRAPFLEQVFGLDRLSRWHHFIGKYLILFLVAHPIFLALAYSKLNEVNFWTQYMNFLQWEDVPRAVVAFWLLILVIGYSLLMVWRNWNFEKWYVAHLLVYVAVVLAFGHQLEVGGDLQVGWPMYYWLGIYAFVFACVGLYRFLLPILLFWKHRFVVERVAQETPGVYSVYITGQKMEEFKFRNGQFVVVRFLDGKRKWQAHPFSLSQGYNGKELRLSIRGIGDFSKEVGGVEPKTFVIIEGPYGVFTEKRLKGREVLLIAGGIGITPIRAIMEDLVKQKKQVVLFYANRTEADIALRGEVEGLALARHWPVHHFISNMEKPAGIQLSNVIIGDKTGSVREGFVGAQALKDLVSDITNYEVFLCGPPPMMSAVTKALLEVGVKKENIYSERFSL